MDKPAPLPPPSGIPSDKIPTGPSLDGLVDLTRLRRLLRGLFHRS